MANRVSTRLKEWLKNLAAFFFGLFIVLLVLEIVLRFFPVTGFCSWEEVSYKSGNLVPRFVQRDYKFIYSLGWNFYHVAKKRINNYGFTNDLDYSRNPDKPVIAIIRDSFVEAFQVDNDKTFFAILQKDFKDYYFYSFGKGSTQLPTYLIYAKYASENFNPKKLIIVIISNDFVESFYELRKLTGYWYFDSQGNIYLKEHITQGNIYHYVRRKIAENSSLVRYLYFNAGLPDMIYKLTNKKGYNGDRVLNISMKAVDYFFVNLPKYTNLKPEDIIFVVDAPREYIYKNDLKGAEESFFGKVRKYFIDKAKQNGYQVVDMLPVFLEHYRSHKRRFEFPTDGHWNELGHKLVARELEKLLKSSDNNAQKQ